MFEYSEASTLVLAFWINTFIASLSWSIILYLKFDILLLSVFLPVTVHTPAQCWCAHFDDSIDNWHCLMSIEVQQPSSPKKIKKYLKKTNSYQRNDHYINGAAKTNYNYWIHCWTLNPPNCDPLNWNQLLL